MCATLSYSHVGVLSVAVADTHNSHDRGVSCGRTYHAALSAQHPAKLRQGGAAKPLKRNDLTTPPRNSSASSRVGTDVLADVIASPRGPASRVGVDMLSAHVP